MTRSVALRIAANAAAGTGVGAGAQALQNAFDPCASLSQGVGKAAAVGGILGGAGSALSQGLGAAQTALARSQLNAASLEQRLLFFNAFGPINAAQGQSVTIGSEEALTLAVSNAVPFIGPFQ